MSYAGMLRNTITTVSSDHESTGTNDNKPRNSASINKQQDKIYLELNDIDKVNARIKRQILNYSNLEKNERQEAR